MNLRLFVRSLAAGPRSFALSARVLGAALVAFLGTAMAAAQSGSDLDENGAETFYLKPEDQLRLSFPGAPELSTDLQVRRDGVIAVPLLGEVFVTGKRPRDLETELSEMYKDQLISNEVRVVVLASHFTYYLEGEIARPGITESFRQLSVLEAIIAAGGVRKETGKLKEIIVLRRVGNKYQRYVLNLNDVLEGKNSEAFILEPYDVVSIPQRIW